MTTTNRVRRGSRRGDRWRARALVVAVLALTAAAGCGTGHPAQSTTPLFPSSSAESETPDADASPANPAPLTGLGTTEATAARPAVAVAVQGGAGHRPAGLGDADLVYEEYSGGSVRHLLAVYQSHDADVGPVDMTRPVDVKLLPVLRPVLAFSGGPLGFVVQVDDAKIHHVNRVSDTAAFSGSKAVTKKARAAAGRSLSAPPSVFSYGTGDLGAGSGKATSLRISAPGEPSVTWRYDPRSGQWRTKRDGRTVSVANLVVQRVSYKTITNKHLPGGTTETALAIGDGKCTVVSRGQHVACTWQRPNRELQTNYADSTGAVVTFTPGRTWVVLAPPGTDVKVGG